MAPSEHHGPGRPRDEGIDARVLAATREQLAEVGYDGLHVATVAAAAGTTRQAVYRRWEDKADLATAAVAAMEEAAPRRVTGDHLVDLVAELEAFRRGISRPHGVSLVGTMLSSSTDHGLVERFRERLVAPRRARVTAILERARSEHLIDADADLEVAVTMLTGSWYARELAGAPEPARWARRTAMLIWRALGGDPGADRSPASDQST